MLSLTGVTRDSIIQLARRLGYDVKEEPVSVREAMEADEVFTTGRVWGCIEVQHSGCNIGA